MNDEVGEVAKIGRSQRWKRGKRVHAISRAWERFGIRISEADLLVMNQRIWRGTEKEFSRPKRKGVRYFVWTEGGHLPVIYHEGRRMIVTILAPDSAEVLRGLRKFKTIKLVKRRGFFLRYLLPKFHA